MRDPVQIAVPDRLHHEAMQGYEREIVRMWRVQCRGDTYVLSIYCTTWERR